MKDKKFKVKKNRAIKALANQKRRTALKIIYIESVKIVNQEYDVDRMPKKDRSILIKSYFEVLLNGIEETQKMTLEKEYAKKAGLPYGRIPLFSGKKTDKTIGKTLGAMDAREL